MKTPPEARAYVETGQLLDDVERRLLLAVADYWDARGSSREDATPDQLTLGGAFYAIWHTLVNARYERSLTPSQEAA